MIRTAFAEFSRCNYRAAKEDGFHEMGNSPMLTVMFAFVLFFGGLATHFVSAHVRVGVLLFGLLLFLATVTILIGMPVA